MGITLLSGHTNVHIFSIFGTSPFLKPENNKSGRGWCLVTRTDHQNHLYISSIEEAYFFMIGARFIFKVGVKNPFSIVQGSSKRKTRRI